MCTNMWAVNRGPSSSPAATVEYITIHTFMIKRMQEPCQIWYFRGRSGKPGAKLFFPSMKNQLERKLYHGPNEKSNKR